jgi:hypothetical protein
MDGGTSTTPYANRTFGVGAMASEKDTNVKTWKMVGVLLCQNEFQNIRHR